MPAAVGAIAPRCARLLLWVVGPPLPTREWSDQVGMTKEDMEGWEKRVHGGALRRAEERK